MTLYNSSLQHEEGEYIIDPNRSTVRMLKDSVQDVMTAWLTESSLKIWIRFWLFFLMMGCMLPLAFLPHPFAITNLVGSFVLMLPFNGRELVRVRGLNKNMGWPHVMGWIPVVVVNILCLTTDWMLEDGKLSWEIASNNYEKARYVVLIYNTVTLSISILFDIADTYMYYVGGETKIERSKWTLDQITTQPAGPEGGRDGKATMGESTEKTVTV